MSNDRYARLREALAMGPTQGPWAYRPSNSGHFIAGAGARKKNAQVEDFLGSNHDNQD